MRFSRRAIGAGRQLSRFRIFLAVLKLALAEPKERSRKEPALPAPNTTLLFPPPGWIILKSNQQPHPDGSRVCDVALTRRDEPRFTKGINHPVSPRSAPPRSAPVVPSSSFLTRSRKRSNRHPLRPKARSPFATPTARRRKLARERTGPTRLFPSTSSSWINRIGPYLGLPWSSAYRLPDQARTSSNHAQPTSLTPTLWAKPPSTVSVPTVWPGLIKFTLRLLSAARPLSPPSGKPTRLRHSFRGTGRS